MNKAELIDALETKLGSKKVASDALEAFLDVVIREVAKGGKVGITGFGTFERADRAARTGRNPKTGATVRIKKTRVPKFRSGTNFKEVVAGSKKLAKDQPAASRASAGSSAPVKKTATKAAPAKTAAKKAATKAAPAKTAVKKTATKAAPAKTAVRKTTATKAAPAKTAVKKTATKAAPARTTARKTTAKKTTGR